MHRPTPPLPKGGFGLRFYFRPVSLLRCSRCKDQRPPCQRGVVWHSQIGGILRGGRFPHGSVVIGSARCESLSHAYGVPAPFNKGALRAVPADNFARWLSTNRSFPDPPGIVIAVHGWVSTTTSKYHPISKPELHRPLAPSVTCGDSSLPEGAIGFCLFT